MKITSSTSMTSIYGTTLISAMSLRFFSAVGMSASQLGPCVAVQNAREFFRKAVVTVFESHDLVGVAVVRDDGRNRGKQAHGRCDQCFRDRRRNNGQRRSLLTADLDKGHHDAPHGAEQADVRTRRANGRECREILFETVDLPHLRDAHSPAALFNNLVRRVPARLQCTVELAETGLEDAGHTDAAAFRSRRTLVERIEV